KKMLLQINIFSANPNVKVNVHKPNILCENASVVQHIGVKKHLFWTMQACSPHSSGCVFKCCLCAG
ncbi:MAG: hypothetical protein MJE68_12230, partial [Proteobacteria bacterium]|nr:hypothetical protein [Pseudomonadota bacterium]